MPTTMQTAAAYLSKNDPTLAPVIAKVGLCTIAPHTRYYQELVESIIGQQISIKAAASILTKFVALFGDTFPAPEAILQKTVDELRSAGLSRAKATYVQDIAQHVVDGRLQIGKLPTLGNEEIIRELVAIKGVGQWTAHMFLMFSLGRLDILPTGDLGFKNGIQKLYGIQSPTPAQITEIAVKNRWHPYESVATWYVWQSLKEPA